MDLHSSINAELKAHPVQAIIDDDIAGMIGRFLEGVAVNEDTLALDIIAKVGHLPGHFLHESHTKKWDNQEQYIPQVAERLSHSDWLASGKRSVLECAKEKHDEILATHKTTPLTSEQETEIEAILKEQAVYYSKQNILT